MSYPLPRIEDIHASLAGGTVFSKLDLLLAGHVGRRVNYVIINTHKGLDHVSRLSFGVASAPLIFQLAHNGGGPTRHSRNYAFTLMTFLCQAKSTKSICRIWRSS